MIKKLPIIEISEVIQGEGKLMGVPSLLIRTTGCPLRCSFGSSRCDTYHASYEPEKGKYDINDIIGAIEGTRLDHVIITGGEPTIHNDLLANLTSLCENNNKHVTLETSGIIAPLRPVDLLSLSPKMSNSIPSVDKVGQEAFERHNSLRINYDAMRYSIGEMCVDYQIKFVVSRDEDIHEINEVVKLLGVPKHRVFLMPEGETQKDLDLRRRSIMDLSLSTGYMYTDRLHIVAYNDQKYR